MFILIFSFKTKQCLIACTIESKLESNSCVSCESEALGLPEVVKIFETAFRSIKTSQEPPQLVLINTELALIEKKPVAVYRLEKNHSWQWLANGKILEIKDIPGMENLRERNTLAELKLLYPIYFGIWDKLENEFDSYAKRIGNSDDIKRHKDQLEVFSIICRTTATISLVKDDSRFS